VCVIESRYDQKLSYILNDIKISRKGAIGGGSANTFKARAYRAARLIAGRLKPMEALLIRLSFHILGHNTAVIVGPLVTKERAESPIQ
jgi:hypothetical protein